MEEEAIKKVLTTVRIYKEDLLKLRQKYRPKPNDAEIIHAFLEEKENAS